MVDLLHPNTFYSVLNPMYYFSKIFGFAPISLTSTYYKRSIINTLWSVIWLITYIVAFASLTKELNREAGYITKLTADLDFYCTNVGVWMGICSECFFAGRIANLVRDIDTFDKKLQSRFKNDIVKAYRKCVIRIYLTIALIIIFMVNYAVCVSLMQPYKTSLIFLGDIMLSIGAPLTNTITIFQFSAIVVTLWSRFRAINDITRTVSRKLSLQNDTIFTVFTKGISRTTTNNMLPSSFVHDKVFIILEDLRNKHNELCRICRNTNTCYSIQILIIVLQNVIGLILALYFGGKSIFLKPESSVFLIYQCCNQLFLATVQIIVLVLICSGTVAEARKTGDLIHNLLASQEPCKEAVYLQASFFSLQLMHINVEFTACGVFAIDASLLLAILGGITTYLVIVVQFEISYPHKHGVSSIKSN